MTPTEFATAHQQFEKYMHDACSDPANQCYPIYDGAIDPEAYYTAPIKIVWLLKEAYDKEENAYSGKWEYREHIGQEDLYENFISQIPAKRMWSRIAYVSYSLLNGFPIYDDMHDLDKQPSMAEDVKKTAVVNTKKLPAVGYVISQDNVISAAFEKNKTVLEKQFTLLQPDIIIGGNVLSLYRGLFGLQSHLGLLPAQQRPYYIKDGQLFIDAYHPAYWTVGDEEYVNDIVHAAREWYTTHRQK